MMIHLLHLLIGFASRPCATLRVSARRLRLDPRLEHRNHQTHRLPHLHRLLPAMRMKRSLSTVHTLHLQHHSPLDLDRTTSHSQTLSQSQSQRWNAIAIRHWNGMLMPTLRPSFEPSTVKRSRRYPSLVWIRACYWVSCVEMKPNLKTSVNESAE